MQFKRVKRSINGVLLLDKPLGFSSNQTLQKVKWLYQAAKAGHTGTLDPLATGILPICFGEATKFSHHLLDANKSYKATLKLGVTTTTGDAEGEVLNTAPIAFTDADLTCVLQSFQGEILQTPPMYPALKHEGKALYEYARSGVDIERQPRQIEIFSLHLLTRTVDTLELEVTCSKGTYIRTLAEDMGAALGCGAHLTALRRTQTAHYLLRDALTIETLESMTEAERDSVLKPVDTALPDLPSVDLNTDAGVFFMQGQAVWISGVKHAGDHKVYIDGQFAGLGTRLPDGKLAPKRLLRSQ